jgi:hypothetical protein
MNKPSWLKNAVAKPTGFYTKSGEKLKGQKLDADFIAEWNGEKKAAPKKAAPVVEEVPVVEKEETPAPVAKKKVTKKKKSFFGKS